MPGTPANQNWSLDLESSCLRPLYESITRSINYMFKLRFQEQPRSVANKNGYMYILLICCFCFCLCLYQFIKLYNLIRVLYSYYNIVLSSLKTKYNNNNYYYIIIIQKTFCYQWENYLIHTIQTNFQAWYKDFNVARVKTSMLLRFLSMFHNISAYFS